MSAFAILTAGLACLAPLVNAYTQPVGSDPVGNPFTMPGLNSIVPAGKDYTIQWQPTTDGTVTLVLLKGPANNLHVVGPIVENIANSGSYDWHVPGDLTPGPTDVTGYGIQLIVDANGQYQYTTQFGISNSNSNGGGSYGSLTWSSAWPSPTTTWLSDFPTASASWTDSASWSSTTDSSTTESSTADASSIGSSIMTSAPASITSATTLATVPASVVVSSASKTASSLATASSSAPATTTGGASTIKSSTFGILAIAGVALYAL